MIKIAIAASWFIGGLLMGFSIWHTPVEKGYPYTDGKKWCTETETAIWCKIAPLTSTTD